MHDPSTVAIRIFGPIGLYRFLKRAYFECRGNNAARNEVPTPEPLFTIWHVDPERDGSDDSCGYTYPRMSSAALEKVQKLGADEFDFMFGKHPALRRASVSEVLFAIWKQLAWRMHNRRKLSHVEMHEIMQLASNPNDNLINVVLEAKYNINECRRLWVLVYRCYLLVDRPWYRHPRWHVHHWKVTMRRRPKQEAQHA